MITGTDLFSPVQVGALALKNRIVMAPMTRCRAGSAGVPGPMNAEYYAQRASAGLIVSEATNISQQGAGFAFTPGIFNDEQVVGWRIVTDAVHAAGGIILCQLWHVGRISHPSMQPNGAVPVAPSAVQPAPSAFAFTEHGPEACPVPRALELNEISGVIEQYRGAALRAKQAGFDGVEVLAGGGYLIDQFLKDKTNRRTDQYGGSISNRARFLLEVVQAVTKVWSGDRVGVRLSPNGTVGDISDSNPEALFSYVVEQLNRFHLAYVHLLEGSVPGTRHAEDSFDMHKLRQLFHGAYIANNCYDKDLAVDARQKNTADLIAFGRPFIANPDLVTRLESGAALAEGDPSTFYAGGGSAGYTDYPALH